MEKIFKIVIISMIMLLAFGCKDKNNNQIQLDDDNYSQTDTEVEADIDSTKIVTEITNDKPKFSVVIDDFGNYNEAMIDSLLVRFCDLPDEVAFAVLPNLAYSERVMDFCFDRNHDILIHTPMQPINTKINPGKTYISPEDDSITIINKLNEFHKQINKAIGINNHMGSLATQDSTTMETVLNWCQATGLFFVDSSTSAKTVGYKMAKEMNVPTAKRLIFLDVPNPTATTIDKYVAKMQKYYEQNRNVLIITHCSSLERKQNLQVFIDKCNEMGYDLVHVTNMLETSELPI